MLAAFLVLVYFARGDVGGPTTLMTMIVFSLTMLLMVRQALILRGDEVVRLEADGPVVGLLAGARYGQSECCMKPGDIFVAFTDGISEALNEREEEWEEERFIPAAQQCRQMPAKDMIQAIFRAADAFTGSAKQYDDMTLLVMKMA